MKQRKVKIITVGLMWLNISLLFSQGKHYTNPILAGFYPDPSICKVNDDYYMVNSTFCYYPGLPIFHSTDLVHWQQIGNAIYRPDQISFGHDGVSRGLFAPDISCHSGIFYIVCTNVSKGGNFVITATHPSGPWSNPYWLPNVNGIDPSLFFDDESGKAWIVYNSEAPESKPQYEGRRAIWMQEFDVPHKITTGNKILLVNGGTDNSLRIQSEGSVYHFFYAEDEVHWEPLMKNADAKFLSTKTAGGFVGCMYAMYATTFAKRSSTIAMFDDFQYLGNDEALQ